MWEPGGDRVGLPLAPHMVPTSIPVGILHMVHTWVPPGSETGGDQVGARCEPGVNQRTKREQGWNQVEAGPGENHDGASPVAGWESGEPGGTWGDVVGATLGVVKHLRLESSQLADQPPGWVKGVGCDGCGDEARCGQWWGGSGHFQFKEFDHARASVAGRQKWVFDIS